MSAQLRAITKNRFIVSFLPNTDTAINLLKEHKRRPRGPLPLPLTNQEKVDFLDDLNTKFSLDAKMTDLEDEVYCEAVIYPILETFNIFTRQFADLGMFYLQPVNWDKVASAFFGKIFYLKVLGDIVHGYRQGEQDFEN